MNLEFVGGPLDGKADYPVPDGQREFHLAVWVPEPFRKLESGEAVGPGRRILHTYQLGGFCRCTPEKYDHEPVWQYEGCVDQDFRVERRRE